MSHATESIVGEGRDVTVMLPLPPPTQSVNGVTVWEKAKTPKVRRNSDKSKKIHSILLLRILVPSSIKYFDDKVKKYFAQWLSKMVCAEVVWITYTGKAVVLVFTSLFHVIKAEKISEPITFQTVWETHDS